MRFSILAHASVRLASASVLVAAVIVGTAAGAGPAATATVTIRLSDTAMRVSRQSVPAGRILFRVQNRSAGARDFQVAGKARTRLLASGGTASLVVQFTSAGLRRLRSAGPPVNRLRVLTGSLRVAAPAQTQTKLPLLELTLVANGFASPTYVVAPPGDSSRLLVVQQNGLVALIKNGSVRPTPFLDLRSVVAAEGEKGLLSVAFPPDYATSGLVYAYYNNRNGNIRVVEYHRSTTDADVVDPTKQRQLLAITKPTADHNGGMMQFGPDGNLYLSVGDGGANPPTIPVGVTGQSLDDLLGSILRIDPRSGNPYAVPARNPFVSVAGARSEIIAYGLRNPWRFSIDAKTNQMLIGDVGEGAREEIDRLSLAKLGANFGWPCKEGTTVPADVAIPASCKTAALTPPLWQYGHSDKRCSIIGGVTSRDPRLPQLAGLYLWSDFCNGKIYALDPAGAKPTPISLRLDAVQPTSFGTDALGHIYVSTIGGSLYRIDPA